MVHKNTYTTEFEDYYLKRLGSYYRITADEFLQKNGVRSYMVYVSSRRRLDEEIFIFKTFKLFTSRGFCGLFYPFPTF